MDMRREEIIRATIRGVRLHGMSGLRVQHIGYTADEVYSLFEGREDLMAQCFEWIERRLGRLFTELRVVEEDIVQDARATARRIWKAYFRWLMDNPDETVFYRIYRESKEFLSYDRGRDYSYFDDFLKIAGWFDKHCDIYSRISRRNIWYHLLAGTASYAKALIEGRLLPEDASEDEIFDLFLFGVSGVAGRRQPEKA